MVSKCRHKPRLAALAAQVTELEQEKQKLEHNNEQLERDKKQLQQENAQLEKAEELRELALCELLKNPIAPCQSAVSSHITPALNRECVRATAQSSRAAVASRHAVGRRALDLLHQALQAQHLVNFDTKQRSMASLEAKHESNSGNLAAKHGEERAEADSAKLALFLEFDAKREAWAVAPEKAAEKLLEEEGSKHAELIESLMATKLREDTEAQKALEENLQNLERSWGNTRRWEPDPKIQLARKSVATSQERQHAYDELLAGYKASWKACQIDSKSKIYFEQQYLQARLKLEEEHQVRLGELVTDWDAVQQRQSSELKTLADKRVATYAGITAAYEAEEAKLNDDRRTVDEWWMHLFNEAAACRRLIDEDEQTAIDEIQRLEAAALAASIEAQSIVPAAQDTSAVPSAPEAAAVAGQVSVSGVTTAPPTSQGGITCDTVVNIDGSGPLIVTPATTTNEPRSSLTNGDSTYPASAKVGGCLPSDNQTVIDPRSPSVHAESDSTCTACKRSSSSNSGRSESDFVMI